MPIRTALVVAALVAAPLASSAADVWVAGSTEKIRPEATTRSTTQAQISAARNEFEAFQVVITGAASGVRASATDLTDGSGRSIGGLRLYREALMNVTQPSALDTQTGRVPDALVPDVDELYGERRNAFPFDVPPGESRAIWVELHVPADAVPGTYAGTVHLTWSGGARDVPVSLTVWPFALPSTASLKSAFGFTWGALGAEHGVSGDGLSAMRALYGRFALDHRVTLSHIDDGNGDLNHFAQYFGPQIDGTGPQDLRGAAMTSVELMGNAGAWSSFFSGKGWSDRLFQYTCDEPPLTCKWSDIPTRASAARAAGVRTLVTTTIQEANKNGVLSSIDIMAPVINFLEDRRGSFAGSQRSEYDGWLAGSPDRELWAYQSCMSHGCGGTVNFGDPTADDQYYTGWPAYEIDASAVRNRAMEWLSFRFDLSGELYYESVEAYGKNPWTTQWAFSGNGDGTFFYPGQTSRIGGSHDIPVASIRLKMIREGMEDYEYLKLLSDLGGAADAQAIAAQLFPHAYETEQSPDALMAARAQLASLIIARSGGGTAGTPTGGGQPTPDGGLPTPDGGQPAPDGGLPSPGSVQAGAAGGGCGSSGGFGLAALLGLVGAAARGGWRRARG